MNLPDAGITDPHIRIFRDRAYLYASHDFDRANTRFDMRDWQVWSSDNLLDWSLESTLKPEQTYIGKPIQGCWATDAVEHKGRYYWFFSEVVPQEDRRQIGVVVGERPGGPWKDYLKGPFLKNGIVPTEVYDPALFKDDDGRIYIIFGVWDYYIAPLLDDMTGIAEAPRRLEILDPEGPYGKGKTDDKVFLHRRNGLYYLSWGCYYAVSHTLMGPYQCKGSFLCAERIDFKMRQPTWPHGPTQGRHGSFFDWHNQSYFTYCDMSHSGNRYFRSSWISYVHYLPGGDIDPIWIQTWGVGQYFPGRHAVTAGHYFAADQVEKELDDDGSVVVRPAVSGGFVTFPRVEVPTASARRLILKFKGNPGETVVSVRRHNPSGVLLGQGRGAISGEGVRRLTIDLPGNARREDLCFVFEAPKVNRLLFHSFTIE